MEIFIQLLAELLFEGAFEMSKYRSVPLWLRWILIILLSGGAFLLGGVLIFGAFFLVQFRQFLPELLSE